MVETTGESTVSAVAAQVQALLTVDRITESDDSLYTKMVQAGSAATLITECNIPLAVLNKQVYKTMGTQQQVSTGTDGDRKQ